MKKVAILTDFLDHDPAYSLCGVAFNQIKILKQNGYTPKVIVKEGFNPQPYGENVDVVAVDPGEIGNNVVNVTGESAGEIDRLLNQLRAEFEGYHVVFTHDIIYQPNGWKYHVAIHRLAKERPDLKFVHWVHSTTPFGNADKMASFGDEVRAPIENSILIVMNVEERDRKASTFGYELDKVLLCPNPIDVAEDYHGVAVHALDTAGAWDADCVLVYPCRLDRGKQVDVPVEILGEMVKMGHKVSMIVADFHSTAGDKATYRLELMEKAMHYELPLVFTSQLGENWSYHIPHKAVMDLFDFADYFVHPSRSECDPLTLPEAMWKRNGIVLNFDLPMFRLYTQFALMGKFSSNINPLDGEAGQTETAYTSRTEYMAHMASAMLYMLQNNPVLAGHVHVRKTRSLRAVWKNHLRSIVEG